MARPSPVRSIFARPAFLITLLISVAGFFSALIGQCILESKYQAQDNSPGSAVGVGWFGIFLQLFVIIAVFTTLASDSIGKNRFQLSIFLAITVVFAVLGCNSGIFADTNFQLAIGAGWLLLAIVDLLWLLYFTSEEETFFYKLFHSRSRNQVARNGQPQNSNPARSIGQRSSMAQGGAAVSYLGASSYQGNKTAAGASVADLSQAGHGGDMMSPAAGGTSLLDGQGGNHEYTLKARALYSYSASPDDPNEITFSKGEILDIVDNTGKWWQAKKSDGAKGIVPSNYLVLL